MRIPELELDEIVRLKKAQSPQAHGGGQGAPSLSISWTSPSNPASIFDRDACWIISDGRGYITATDRPYLLALLCRIEVLGGVGTVRELITGVPKIVGEEPPATPEALPTIEDLLG